MSESNRVTRTNRPRLPWTIQQIHQNSQHFASTATQHIHELQGMVLQGLSPLITSARSSQSSPSRSHSSDHHAATPQSRNLAGISGVNPGNVVIDIDDLVVEEPFEQNSSTDQNANSSNSPNAANNTGDHDPASLRNSPELHAVIAFVEKYFPFVMILLLKLAFDHRIGILVNLGLFITFCHANTTVKKEVAKQGKRRLRTLLLICVNLVTSIFVIYTLLADHTLAYALIFVPPYTAPIDFWDVLWIVCVTDYVLKLVTILVKLLFIAFPARIIAYQKKGKYYLFIERSSQLYRTLVPMQHWLYFFSESYTGPSKVFGVILSAAYLIFKAKNILKKGKLWKDTLIKVIQSKTYGVAPSSNQIKEAGDACPICQDDYKSPSMLQCKHIFCEECVALWFDRERTCPICRAQIADDPTWRDGATTILHQIF